MIPRKFLRDKHESEKRRKIFQHTIISLVFISCFLLIGQLIHEFSHLIFLEFKDCLYRFRYGFGALKGFFASVRPFCNMNSLDLTFFYLNGYLSTFTVGTVLALLGYKHESFRAKIKASAGSGMLLSIVLSIGAKGDIQNALEIHGLEALEAFIVVPIILIIFLVSLGASRRFLN